MRRLALPVIATALSATLAVGLASCSGGTATTATASPAGASSSSSVSSNSGGSPQGAASSKPTQKKQRGVDPNAPEVVAPGDIPDDQVFVRYRWPEGGFSVTVPEGWARTGSGPVTFTDKYNSIEIASGPTSSQPTVSSVRTAGLGDVKSDPSFHLRDVTAVVRPAGTGVLATYTIGSKPNPVTGKRALLAVERYVFARGGQQVVLTLSGATGADNVDPWRTVTDSLTWS